MAAPSSNLDDGFTRRLQPGEPALIESRCNHCGLVILGSAMNGLEEKEREHRLRCLPGQNVSNA